MMNNRRVNGWDFEFISQDEDHSFFQSRGAVMYDDEHDEICEPSLWRACLKLENDLEVEGHRAEANYSEKGWVEVTI